MATKKKLEKKKLKTITSPIKIGPLELKNRMWLAPMNETLSGHDGQATEQPAEYTRERRSQSSSDLATTCRICRPGLPAVSRCVSPLTSHQGEKMQP